MESKQTTTWYKTCFEVITEVEVIEELPKSLKIYNKYRSRNFQIVRNNSYEKYFKTREEAKDSIIEDIKKYIENAEKSLRYQQEKLAKFLNSGK